METGVEPDPSVQPQSGVLVPLKPRARKLSEELERLIHEFQTRSVTLRELIVVLQGRAYDLLLLLLALPFLLPIPLPGLSVAFGAIIAVISARLVLGQRPWLPQRLLDTTLPPKFFPVLLASARRIIRVFELLLRPRLLWITSSRLPQLHALLIFAAAIVLMLPLPPGTNFPPAVVIVVMAGGLLERDGLFVLAGYVAAALNVAFFATFSYYFVKFSEALWHRLFG